MSGRILLAFCCTYLALVLVAAVAAPLLVAHSPYEQNPEARREAPSSTHWLGTDHLGRDVASRLVHGARVSMGVGLAVVVATVVIGSSVGIAAALRGGRVDSALMRLTDGLFAFPDILLAILIVGIAGPGPVPVIAALTAVGWPGMARLVRGQTLSLRQSLFVRAARAAGASTTHTVLRHLVPHLSGVVLAAATVDLASVVLAESALSFLGIGIPPPHPSWGSLISTGREYIRTDWLLVFVPCATLSLTVISLNLLGDHLKAKWDPRSAR